MKKNTLNIILIGLIMFTVIYSPVVLADEGNTVCYMTENLRNILRDIVFWIRVIASLLLVALLMVDIFNIVMKPDKDEKTSGRPDIVKKMVVRVGVIVAMFVLPWIINLIFKMAGQEAIFCGIL